MHRRLRVLVPALLALAAGCTGTAGAATGGVSPDDLAAASPPQAAGGTQDGAKLPKARPTRPRVTLQPPPTPIRTGPIPRLRPRIDERRIPPGPAPVAVPSPP